MWTPYHALFWLALLATMLLLTIHRQLHKTRETNTISRKRAAIYIKTDIKNVHHLSQLVQLRSSDFKQPVLKYVFLIIHWQSMCIVTYHFVSYRFTLYCTYCIVLYCIVSYRISSYRIVSYRITSHRIVSYCIVSYHNWPMIMESKFCVTFSKGFLQCVGKLNV